ncbi:ExbD/TolR family protein [Marinithermus hydrothermalis]|uniref:Biopolymer transport protein ExbD/TolR n=1 Tax=Marinithermus hydrothermalis (strain DSM 14884 / JCM 11576 / T1) TaxID=869210 RepID=F2NPD4_MARHT|nr:biopolymer transporter ExbD [Marinithermus hydrothermalis]AEB12215.1 Biopolymer transport protein ExbD/TolR [Marinithermus hydrothermalis DSM 14884]
MRRRPKLDPAINLAPFIDIVFLLVVFFMVTSTFITPETGLPIDLPGAVTGEAKPASAPVVVLDAQGQAHWQGQAVDDATLLVALRGALVDDPVGTVVLRADRKVPHGRVVEVMDTIRRAGAKRVAIAVIP